LLQYTLCFIRDGDRLLMLRRRFKPFPGQLNGVGGKIEPGETPLACVLREVEEETGVVLQAARFGGIVTWTGFTLGPSGMYVYLASLPTGSGCSAGETPEGTLEWQSIADVLALRYGVVTNIPPFLGPMLAGAEPAEYAYRYAGDEMLGWEVRPLPAWAAAD